MTIRKLVCKGLLALTLSTGACEPTGLLFDHLA